MRSHLYDIGYSRSTKNPKQSYDSEQSAGEEYMKAFTINSRQLLSRNKEMMMQKPLRRSGSKRQQRRSLIYGSDEDRFPWEDRYKGKSKQKEISQKNVSQKEKIRVEQKNIQYDKVFDELCYGNGSDVVSAGIMYKDVVEAIVLHLMEKQLEMEVYFAKKSPSDIPKQLKQQEKQQQNKQIKEEITVEKLQLKAEKKKNQSINNHKKDSEPFLQLADSQLQESIDVPLKQNNQNKQSPQEKIIAQNQQNLFCFKQDLHFYNTYKTFKRISSTNNIMSVIPYKSIPSLFLISSLNFIILKTTEPMMIRYFPPDGKKMYEIYKDLYTIAQASKKYLVEEKLLKGMRYFTEVEEKLNKIYAKKGFKPKTLQINSIVKQQNNEGDSTKNDSAHTESEQRKTSTRSDESPNLEERKEETSKTGSKQK